jgi:hypothetical protein
LWELLRRTAFFLLPVPEHDSQEPDELFKWRQAVAVAIIFEGAILVAFILSAVGYLSFAGISGFALSADLSPLLKQGVESRIAADRTLQCRAIMEGNQASMNYSYGRLQEDIDAYVRVSRVLPRIPDCAELIPTGSEGVIAPTPRPTAAK